MIETITEFTGDLSGLLWNNGLTMLILVGTGLYLTIRLRFVQLTGFRHGWVLISGKLSRDTDSGEVSHFQALDGLSINLPAAAHGRLLVRNKKELACFRLLPASP